MASFGVVTEFHVRNAATIISGCWPRSRNRWSRRGAMLVSRPIVAHLLEEQAELRSRTAGARERVLQYQLPGVVPVPLGQATCRTESLRAARRRPARWRTVEK